MIGNLSHSVMNTFSIRPKSVIRLVKLWPYARKQGHKVGELWRIGYYSKLDGANVIWLVDEEGSYQWTVDCKFIADHFVIIEASTEKSYYGDNREKLGRLARARSKNVRQKRADRTSH